MLNKFHRSLYNSVKLLIFKFLAFLGGQLGNPETSEAEDWDGWVDYAWSHAVISDELYGVIKEVAISVVTLLGMLKNAKTTQTK